TREGEGWPGAAAIMPEQQNSHLVCFPGWLFCFLLSGLLGLYFLTLFWNRPGTLARVAASGYFFSCASSFAIRSSSGGWVENQDPFLTLPASTCSSFFNTLISPRGS